MTIIKSMSTKMLFAPKLPQRYFYRALRLALIFFLLFPINSVFSETPPALMVHYEFNEGTGQTVADSSGNGLTGTLGTTSGVDGTDPTWVCTNNGFAMEFNASNSTRLRSPTFTPPGNGAFAFWSKIPAAPTIRQRIFGFNNDWEVRAEASDILFLDVNTGGNNNMRSSGPQSVTNTWSHIAMNTNSSTNDWEFYIDIVLDNSGNNPQSQRAARVLSLGMSTWRNREYFMGTIDDFRIYSGNLSQAEITALAANRPTTVLQFQ